MSNRDLSPSAGLSCGARPRLLDLFSGIGGFSLGLERAGFETVAFCEVNPKCRHLLAHHWPQVPCYDDIRTLTADRLAADGIAVDAICGGFPCQDLSKAGKRAGLAGARSGLWFEYARLISEIRPQFVFIENVTRLRSHGLDQILGGLDALGYDAEWHCIPAAAVGAPDIRDRLWIIAYPQHSYTHGVGPHQATIYECRGFELFDKQISVPGPLVQAISGPGEGLGSAWRGGWRPEPGVRRVVDGSPAVTDRLISLGNSLKPQIPEILGRAALAAINAKREAA